MRQSFAVRDHQGIFCRASELLDRQDDARIDEQRICPISRGQFVIGEMRPHKGPFPGVEVPLSVLGRRASIREMRRNRV